MSDNIFIPGSGIQNLANFATPKSLHTIFVVDNSGSMNKRDSTGKSRMDAVNEAFHQLVEGLKKRQRELKAEQNDRGNDFQIYISILVFNEDPEWHMMAVPVNDSFVFQDIPVSKYVTYYSRAFQELNRKMDPSEIFSQTGKRVVPYVMLMTDGAPTPTDQYEPVLEEMKNNKLFAVSSRYAVLIGEDVINDPSARQAVSSFVSNEEGIISAIDSSAIIDGVSAATLHAVDNATQHNPHADEENKNTANPFSQFNQFNGSASDGKDPFDMTNLPF